MKLPILPTTVIGSYSMPEWLERAKNDYLSRRLSRRDLDEMHDAVRKAAIKDQEVAGIDIVTDGELQRDNMIDYFTERLPGVQVDLGSKRFYYDFYESVVRSKLATGSLGLVEEVRFVRRYTRTRPEDLGVGAAYARQAHPEPVLSQRRSLRARPGAIAELRAERAHAGGRDRAPDRRALLLRVPRGSARGPSRRSTPPSRAWTPTSRCTSATATATGSRRSRAATGICSPRFSRPRCTRSRSSSPRRGEEDLELFREFKAPFTLGLGVIDVKTQEIEPPTLVADRIRRALEIVPAERLVINPDCGCVHLSRDIAFSKLAAMVEGTRMVRKDFGQ